MVDIRTPRDLINFLTGLQGLDTQADIGDTVPEDSGELLGTHAHLGQELEQHDDGHVHSAAFKAFQVKVGNASMTRARTA